MKTNEITLNDVLNAILKRKRDCSFVAILFIVLGTIYSLSLQDKYTSEAVLAGASNMTESSLGSSYSSLASLAGINIPGSSNSLEEAIETMKSFDFFKTSVLPHIFLPDLFAVDSWDKKNNLITYNESIYNSTLRQWSDVTKVPSAQAAFFKFYNEFLTISYDRSTGFLTLSAEHNSPHIAYLFVQTIFRGINESLREQERDKADKSLEYVKSIFAETSNYEIRLALTNLIESQTQKLMLIESNADYVFKSLQNPYIPENKSSPKRTIIFLVSIFIGIIFAGLFAIFAEFFRQDSE